MDAARSNDETSKQERDSERTVKLSRRHGKRERSESETELPPLLALELAQLPLRFVDFSGVHR